MSILFRLRNLKGEIFFAIKGLLTIRVCIIQLIQTGESWENLRRKYTCLEIKEVLRIVPRICNKKVGLILTKVWTKTCLIPPARLNVFCLYVRVVAGSNTGRDEGY